MAEQKVDLTKIRDFGENMNDTFLFIRQNFSPLLKSFLAICAIFMLSQAIFNGMYQSRSIAILRDLMSGSRNNKNPFGVVTSPVYIFTVIIALLTFVSMSVALGAYFKSYSQNSERPPAMEEVWAIFMKYYLKVLVFIIPIYILVMIGCVFCLVPGIYLWVTFVPFSLVIMIEDTGFLTSISRCFDLVRENFWSSLAIYLISYIVYKLCGLMIGGMIALVVALAGYLSTDDLGNSFAVATSFLNVFAFCFYIIFFVSAALNYFSLVESRDGTGILNRIDNIGKKKTVVDGDEEQY
ncbi:MAG: hypothetical protein WKF89_12080 [Chitinophagaceae bacterium]